MSLELEQSASSSVPCLLSWALVLPVVSVLKIQLSGSKNSASPRERKQDRTTQSIHQSLRTRLNHSNCALPTLLSRFWFPECLGLLVCISQGLLLASLHLCLFMYPWSCDLQALVSPAPLPAGFTFLALKMSAGKAGPRTCSLLARKLLTQRFPSGTSRVLGGQEGHKRGQCCVVASDLQSCLPLFPLACRLMNRVQRAL